LNNTKKKIAVGKEKRGEDRLEKKKKARFSRGEKGGGMKVFP